MHAFQPLIDSVVAIAARRVAEADTSKSKDRVLMGEWVVRQQTLPVYQHLATLGDVDPDEALRLLDALIGSCLGVMLGQKSSDQNMIANPLGSLEMSGALSGSQRILSDLLVCYAESERGVAGEVLARSLLVSDEHAARVAKVIADDFDRHG